MFVYCSCFVVIVLVYRVLMLQYSVLLFSDAVCIRLQFSVLLFSDAVC